MWAFVSKAVSTLLTKKKSHPEDKNRDCRMDTIDSDGGGTAETGMGDCSTSINDVTVILNDVLDDLQKLEEVEEKNEELTSTTIDAENTDATDAGSSSTVEIQAPSKEILLELIHDLRKILIKRKKEKKKWKLEAESNKRQSSKQNSKRKTTQKAKADEDREDAYEFFDDSIPSAPVLNKSEFIKSVHWYVRASVQDLVNEIETVPSAKLPKLIQSILDLPLEFDGVTENVFPEYVFRHLMSNKFPIRRQAQFWEIIFKLNQGGGKGKLVGIVGNLMTRFTQLTYEILTSTTDTDELESELSLKAAALLKAENVDTRTIDRINNCIVWFQQGNIKRSTKFVKLLAHLIPLGVASNMGIMNYMLKLTKRADIKAMYIFECCIEKFGNYLVVQLLPFDVDRNFSEPYTLQQMVVAQLYGKCSQFLKICDFRVVPVALISRVKIRLAEIIDFITNYQSIDTEEVPEISTQCKEHEKCESGDCCANANPLGNESKSKESVYVSDTDFFNQALSVAKAAEWNAAIFDKEPLILFRNIINHIKAVHRMKVQIHKIPNELRTRL